MTKAISYQINNEGNPNGFSSCFCIGPQEGQTKCPCVLRLERSEKAIPYPKQKAPK